MSAAVRIMAPRMSPEASGWRAIASTAWPPIRPMPIPTPITARPSPRPAPSSAFAFLAAAASSAPVGCPCMSVTRSTMVSSTCVRSMRVLHHADEHRREQRKDIGLQERHQQLEQHHEHDERDRASRDRPVREDEDQAEQRENHEMTGRHVGEQPERERERLDDLSDDLDRRHDQCHEYRARSCHARRHEHDRLEIAPGAEGAEPRDLDHEERDEGQRSGHRQIPRGGRAPREQPEQIAIENEEEKREDVGHELLAAVPDVAQHHVVSDEQHDRLDGRPEPGGRLPFPLPALDLAARVPDREEHEHRGDHHEDDVLGRRDVDAEQVPPGGKVPLAQPERQLHHVAVRRVLEDDLADVGRLHHRKNLVSRKSSGSNTPRNPSDAGSGGSASRCVAATARSAPSARARTPMPPSQRAMNTGCGACIAGRSSATAPSCAASAAAPPIAAGRPPNNVTTITSTAPSVARRRYGLTPSPSPLPPPPLFPPPVPPPSP